MRLIFCVGVYLNFFFVMYFVMRVLDFVCCLVNFLCCFFGDRLLFYVVDRYLFSGEFFGVSLLLDDVLVYLVRVRIVVEVVRVVKGMEECMEDFLMVDDDLCVFRVKCYMLFLLFFEWMMFW